MILTDVNVLVYAFRDDSPGHLDYAEWLNAQVNAPTSFGYSPIVLSSFLRIVTHPKIFSPPSTIQNALSFVAALTERDNAVPVKPGPRHWRIFTQLCRQPGVKGNLVPDAFLAAIAIESGCTWITTDGDFARFPSLNWRHPLN